MFPLGKVLTSSRRKGSIGGKLELIREREEWGFYSPLPEMIPRTRSLL
jgi:hypothetical protein